MDVRAGYKNTDVGTVPEDWDIKALDSLFEVTSSKRVFQSEWKSQGVPFYRARELAVLGEFGVVANELFITREMYERFKLQYGVPEVGDMLVTGVGTLGKTYVVTDEHEFYFKDGNIIWFKIGESVSSEFLRQLYLTPAIIKQIGDGSAGTTVGTYTISGAKKTVIPVPPPPEQRAIADALGDADALLGGLDRLIAKKRDLKQAAMQKLLTGQTRLPGFSGEWNVKQLGDALSICHGKSQKEVAVADGPFPILATSGHIGTASRSLWDRPSVLIGRKGTINQPQYMDTPFWSVDTLFYSAMKDGNVAKFFFYRFCLIDWLQYNEASGVPSLNARTIESIEVAYPDPSEQTAIATVLSDMDAELEALKSRRAKTRDLKQAMMQELLTGKTRLVTPEAAHA